MDDEIRSAASSLMQVLERRRSSELSSTVHPPSAAARSLLESCRENQVVQRTARTKATRLINVYQVEKSLNSLQWKRLSEIITIGTLTDSDGYDTVKQKCASAFGVTAGDEDLVLTRGNAKIDRSAFPSLGMYLGFLSQQQRARVSFGIGVEVQEENVGTPGTKYSEGSHSFRTLPSASGSAVDSDVEESHGSHQSQSPVHMHPSEVSFEHSRSHGVLQSACTKPAGFPQYSFQFLLSATNNCNKMDLLGTGAFGEVYYGRLRSTPVAVKFFNKSGIWGVISQVMWLYLHELKSNQQLVKNMETLSQEASILSRYSHPNLVLLLGVCQDPVHPAIVYEYMENGSLHDLLFSSLPEGHRKLGDIQMRSSILLEAATGLAYLHSTEGGLSAVVHLDVKSSNILLDGTMKAKIGDFGFAMEIPDRAGLGGKSFFQATTVCGTTGFVAPEFHRGEVGPKSNVFSFGVVVLEMYSELKAYDPDRDITMLHEMFGDALQDLATFRHFCGTRLKDSEQICRIPYDHLWGITRSCLCARHKRVTMDKVVDALEALVHLKLVVID